MNLPSATTHPNARDAKPISSRLIPWGELIERHPTLRSPLIEGLLRKGETMNIIANSKVGKSWLVNDLAISVATGKPWLGLYPTVQGRVLIIDNELHCETIAHRLRQLAMHRGLDIRPDDDSLTVWPLRGRLLDMHQIRREVQSWERGEFAFVIMDAFYRTLPPTPTRTLTRTWPRSTTP